MFVLMGAFAGFTSARLFKTFKGDDVDDDHPFIYLPTIMLMIIMLLLMMIMMMIMLMMMIKLMMVVMVHLSIYISIYSFIYLSIYLYIYLLLIRQAMAEVHSPHGLPLSRHPLQCILHPRRPRVGLWVRV